LILLPWNVWNSLPTDGSSIVSGALGGMEPHTLSWEPLEVIEKLAALIPAPHAHLVRYAGILAHAAKSRPLIVLTASEVSKDKA